MQIRINYLLYRCGSRILIPIFFSKKIKFSNQKKQQYILCLYRTGIRYQVCPGSTDLYPHPAVHWTAGWKKNSGSAPATAPLHWRPFLPHILIFPLVTGASWSAGGCAEPDPASRLGQHGGEAQPVQEEHLQGSPSPYIDLLHRYRNTGSWQ